MNVRHSGFNLFSTRFRFAMPGVVLQIIKIISESVNIIHGAYACHEQYSATTDINESSVTSRTVSH